MQKIKKFWCAVRKQSLKKSNFGSNLTISTHPQGVKSFFQKSENFTFLRLCCSNFMQNIKNFWHMDPEISALRTNKQTDKQTNEAEFIRTLLAKAVGPIRKVTSTRTNFIYKVLEKICGDDS